MMMKASNSQLRLVLSRGNSSKAKQTYVILFAIIILCIVYLTRYDVVDTINIKQNLAENVGRLLANAERVLVNYVPRRKLPYETCDARSDRNEDRQLRISYVFLSSENLPLWPVWEEYFSTCKKADVIVHSVKPINISSEISIHQLSPEDTVRGGLRFSYRMIQATLQLYRSALTRACGKKDIRNCDANKLPDFIQLLSDSCAPSRTCADVNSYLQEKVGKSFVEKTPAWASYREDTNTWDTYKKSSQWTTLTGKHALQLVLNEDKLKKRWFEFNKYNKKAPDEFLTATEMANWGLETHERVLTFSWWKNEQKEFDIGLLQQGLEPLSHDAHGYSHPVTFDTPEYVNYLLSNTPEFLFVRKIEGETASNILIENLKRGKICLQSQP